MFQEPYGVNLLIGGYDTDENKTELHYMDYLAASVPINFYAFGYGGAFTISILDTYYRPGNYLFMYYYLIFVLSWLIICKSKVVCCKELLK